VDGVASAVFARELRECVARAASDAEMFLCRFEFRQPPATKERYSESQRRGNPRIATVFRSRRGVWKRSLGQSGRQIKGTSTPDKRTAASFISTTRCHVLRLSKGPPIFLLALEYSLRHWTSRKSKSRPVVGDLRQGLIVQVIIADLPTAFLFAAA